MPKTKHTNTKRFTIVTVYGEHKFQYVTSDQLAAKGQIAILTIWDEGACSARRVLRHDVVPANKARAHAKAQIEQGRHWQHDVETARTLVWALRRAAGTLDLSRRDMENMGSLY